MERLSTTIPMSLEIPGLALGEPFWVLNLVVEQEKEVRRVWESSHEPYRVFS
jgi:hypothetical protein